MEFIQLNVEQFLRYLAAPTDVLQDAPQKSTQSDFDRTVTLVWADESHMRFSRPLIVVKDDYVREFLAFVSTYVKTFAPFTAFFRVMTDSHFERMQDLPFGRSSELSKVPHELVGVVIAEAFTQIGARAANVAAISFQACQATLSMTMLECLNSGYGTSDVLEIAENWIATKGIFAADELSLPLESIAHFWFVIAATCVDPAPLPENLLPYPARDAVESFVRGRELTAREWRGLCELEPRLADTSQLLWGSKEERLQHFDEIVRIIQSSRRLPRSLQDLVLGAAASSVANGSLSYLSLTRAFVAENPGAILWFAFFTSLHKKNDVFTVGDSLGRHVENRLFTGKSLFDRPTCDISLEELQVGGIMEKGPRFRTLQGSSVTVELAPLVQGKFRTKAARSTDPQVDALVSSERWNEVKYLVDRLVRAVHGMPETQPSVPRTPADPGAQDKQRDFFETRPKGSRRSSGPKKAK